MSKSGSEHTITAAADAGRDLNKEAIQGLFHDVSTGLKAKLATHPKAPSTATLVVHGGAAIVSQLGSRVTTRDVDYLASPFDRALEKLGIEDGNRVLIEVIETIADKQGMGHGWMNFDAEQALMNIDFTMVKNGNELDVFTFLEFAAKKADIVLYNDGYLKILALPWSWAFARKIDRWVPKHGSPDKDKLDAAIFLWISGKDRVVEAGKTEPRLATVERSVCVVESRMCHSSVAVE